MRTFKVCVNGVSYEIAVEEIDGKAAAAQAPRQPQGDNRQGGRNQQGKPQQGQRQGSQNQQGMAKASSPNSISR